jgi:hypothetical protein
MHKVNDRMLQRVVDLHRRLEQIVSETGDANERELAIRQLRFSGVWKEASQRRFRGSPSKFSRLNHYPR